MRRRGNVRRAIGTLLALVLGGACGRRYANDASDIFVRDKTPIVPGGRGNDWRVIGR